MYSANGRRDGVVVRASVLQPVGLEFISQVESFLDFKKRYSHIFPVWRSVQKGWCGEQACKLACVLEQDT